MLKYFLLICSLFICLASLGLAAQVLPSTSQSDPAIEKLEYGLAEMLEPVSGNLKFKPGAFAEGLSAAWTHYSEIRDVAVSENKKELLLFYKRNGSKEIKQRSILARKKINKKDLIRIKEHFLELSKLYNLKLDQAYEQQVLKGQEYAGDFDLLPTNIRQIQSQIQALFGDNLIWTQPDVLSLKNVAESKYLTYSASPHTGLERQLYTEEFMDVNVNDIALRTISPISKHGFYPFKFYLQSCSKVDLCDPISVLAEDGYQVEELPDLRSLIGQLQDFFVDWDQRLILMESVTQMRKQHSQEQYTDNKLNFNPAHYAYKRQDPVQAAADLGSNEALMGAFYYKNDLELWGNDDLENVLKSYSEKQLFELSIWQEAYKNFTESGDYALAEMALDSALYISPENAYLLEERAYNHYYQGRTTKSRAAVEHCLSRPYFSKMRLLLFALQNDLFKVHDKSPWEQSIDQVAESSFPYKNAHLTEVYYFLAEDRFEKGRYTEARKNYEKLIAVCDVARNPTILLKLASACANTYKYQETIDYSNEYLKLDPYGDVCVAHAFKAFAHHRMNESEQSTVSLNQAKAEINEQNRDLCEKYIDYSESSIASSGRGRRSTSVDFPSLGTLFQGASMLMGLSGSNSSRAGSSTSSYQSTKPTKGEQKTFNCNSKNYCLEYNGSFWEHCYQGEGVDLIMAGATGTYLGDTFEEAKAKLCD